MIQLSVPAHLSIEHADQLAAVAETGSGKCRVHNVFGSRAASEIGHARTAQGIPDWSWSDLEAYVDRVHHHGIRFHYTVNSPWSGGKERSRRGLARIRRELDRLAETGVDSFVVANPLLLKSIREWYPEIGIVASINLFADSLQGVGLLFDLGADHVVLDRSVNRNFALIERITLRFGERVSLLANSMCFPHCPYRVYHAIESGWLSMAGRWQRPPDLDEVLQPNACRDYCLHQMIVNPAIILQCPWILPEDLPEYALHGVQHVKVQGRLLSAAEQLRLVEGYLRFRTPMDDFMGLFPGLRSALQQLAGAQLESACQLRSLLSLRSSDLCRLGFLRFFASSEFPCRSCGSECHYCGATLDKLSSGLRNEQASLQDGCGSA